jgi:hypothetical protein
MSKHYPTGEPSEQKVIVVRCPDLRFAKAQHRFVKEELGLKKGYYTLSQAGGVIALARPSLLPGEFSSLFGQIKMFLDMHKEITHIVIINHEDCKKYSQEINRKKSEDNPEKKDLLVVADFLRLTFPGVQIGAYYARFTDEGHKEIVFETVFETNRATALKPAQT